MSEALTKERPSTPIQPETGAGDSAVVAQALIADLAAIFPGRIDSVVASPSAGGSQALAGPTPQTPKPKEGTRTVAEIKGLLKDGLTAPVVPPGHDEIGERFKADMLEYSNLRNGVFSQLGGEPSSKPIDLNDAYDALVERHASLTRSIDGAVVEEEHRRAEAKRQKEEEDARRIAEEKKRREEALKAEPSKNNALNTRIQELQKGKFEVKHFTQLYAGAKVPPKEPAKSEGLDAREAARTVLADALLVGEAFKADFAALREADAAVSSLGEGLSKAYKGSRPDVPAAGIGSAADYEKVKANGAKVRAWIDGVKAAGTYAVALKAFDQAWSKADEGAWPANAAAAMKRVRTEAEAAAGTAAASGGSLDAACTILADGKGTVEAGARYAAVLRRVTAKRGKIPVVDGTADYGLWIDSLAKTVADNADPKAADFEGGAKDLADAEAHIQPCTAYLAALTATRAEVDKVKRLVTPGTKTEAGKADKVIDTAIAEALKSGNGFEFAEAATQLKDVDTLLADARTARTKAVTDRAGTLVTDGSAGKAVFEKLGTAKDAGGESLIAELYLQFGETDFPKLLGSLNGAKPNAGVGHPDSVGLDADKTAANVKALGASVGAAGIKALTKSFGANTADGGQKLGATMKHGMTADQVGELHDAYDLGDPAGLQALKGVFGTSFRGNPEAFATIVCKGLKGPPPSKGKKAEDKCVGNLKTMTDAFGSDAKVQTLIDGVTQNDKTVTQATVNSMTTLEKAKLASEQCAAGAKRMDNLLVNRFKGDAEKLKDPFFDQLEGHPDAEYNKLRAAKQALDDYWALSDEDREGVDEPEFTQKMFDRYTRLKDAQPTHPTLTSLVRNAATLELKPVSGLVPALGATKCFDDDAKHFEERHSRISNSLRPPALADDTTPVGDEQDKPVTFWPEGTTAAQIKGFVESAMATAGPPPGTWTQQGAVQSETKQDGTVIDRVFFTKDVSINVPSKAGGKDIVTSVELRLGARGTRVTAPGKRTKQNPNPPPTITTGFRLTQFYPRSSPGLDTLAFEDMQTVKAALGLRATA